MLDTTRISPYIVRQQVSRKKYMTVVDFKCTTVLQQIDVAKILAKMVVSKELYQHKKRGFYPMYSKNKSRPTEWKKFPIGVATVGALM